jgi:hypothetical protein
VLLCHLPRLCTLLEQVGSLVEGNRGRLVACAALRHAQRADGHIGWPLCTLPGGWITLEMLRRGYSSMAGKRDRWPKRTQHGTASYAAGTPSPHIHTPRNPQKAPPRVTAGWAGLLMHPINGTHRVGRLRLDGHDAHRHLAGRVQQRRPDTHHDCAFLARLQNNLRRNMDIASSSQSFPQRTANRDSLDPRRKSTKGAKSSGGPYNLN